MIKGIASMVLGAIITALIVFGMIYLFFSGIIFWIIGAIAVTFMVGAIILLLIVFLLSLIHI